MSAAAAAARTPLGRFSIGLGLAELVAPRAMAQLAGGRGRHTADDDLKRLKQVLETGEVVRSDGSPEGLGRIAQRPAQPAGAAQ